MSAFLNFDQFRDQMISCWENIESSHQTIYPNTLQKDIATLSDLNKKTKSTDALGQRKIRCLEQKIAAAVTKQRTDIIREVYSLYENAFSGTLPCMLIGNNELRISKAELLNFGALSRGKPACAKSLISDLPELTRGAILCDSKWDLFCNDIYILASIHAKKTFYLSNEETTPLWNARDDRPFLAGREIGILTMVGGYKQVAPDDLREKYGPTFVCLYPAQAERVTIDQVLSATSRIRSIDSLRPLMEYTPPNHPE